MGVECLVLRWSALCGGGVPCVGAECLCWGGVPCVGVECFVLGRSVEVECLVQSKGMHSLGQHLGLPEEQQAGPTLI